MRGCSALIAESQYNALEATMRHLLLVAGILVVTVGVGTSARAQSYPWCAVLNMGAEAYNCGFVSSEQCMTCVSGIGGFCMQNNTYQPPPGPHPPTRAQKHYPN